MRRAHSHHDRHHHGHHDRHRNCTDVTWDEWVELFEREALMRHENEELRKAIGQRDDYWQRKIQNLEIENRTLRQNSEALEKDKHRLVRELEEIGFGWRNKWTRLQNENDSLKEKVKRLEDKCAKLEALVDSLEKRLKSKTEDYHHLERIYLRVNKENVYLRQKLEYYEGVTEPPRRRFWGWS